MENNTAKIIAELDDEIIKYTVFQLNEKSDYEILIKRAKRIETPPRVNATGKPMRRLRQITKNNSRGKNSIIYKEGKYVCKTL